jgi:hypothetical protein
MKVIKGEHRLPSAGAAQRPAEDDVEPASRSEYTYLFPDVADDDRASLFPGKTSKQTLSALKEIESLFMEAPPKTERMKIPPVYTYFGQFINHDMSAPVGNIAAEAATFPAIDQIGNTGPAPDLDKQSRASSVKPILEAIKNEQPNPLSLDSLYGNGPDSEDNDIRRLYDADGVMFRIGESAEVSDEDLQASAINPSKAIRKRGAPDLPRSKHEALIADLRNDENLIISQLHLALLLFHNNAAMALRPEFSDRKQLFAEARKELTLHYQWCILHDFLPQLLWEDTLDEVLSAGPKPAATAGVPMEFTTAAFRFGHSLVSDTYDFNDNFGIGGKLTESASLLQLFTFTSRGGMANGKGGQLPNHWIADWKRLTRTSSNKISGSDKIDLALADGMLNKMAHGNNLQHASIFFRNILRGYHRRIPFGQELAGKMRVKIVPASDIADMLPANMADLARELDLTSHTPAWLYFLCEARHFGKGEKLGPAASRIIAETFVGALKKNPESILNLPGGWTPARRGRIRVKEGPINDIRDLLEFSGVLS